MEAIEKDRMSTSYGQGKYLFPMGFRQVTSTFKDSLLVTCAYVCFPCSVPPPTQMTSNEGAFRSRIFGNAFGCPLEVATLACVLQQCSPQLLPGLLAPSLVLHSAVERTWNHNLEDLGFLD